MEKDPIIRIGLTTSAQELRISSRAPLVFREKVPEARQAQAGGEIVLRVEQAGGEARDSYRIQIAALSRREAAATLARKLEAQFPQPVLVRDNIESRLFQVRLGDFGSREEAGAFASASLAPAGYRDTVVVRESLQQAGRGSVLSLRGGGILNISRIGFLISPSEQGDFLRVDGKPYRGILDVRLNRGSRITLVNQVALEDYLLGVVPAEISPTTYPQFAVLAAQAIAARTYGFKNMGRFAAEGFDLTADVRSQVYGGIAQERDATSDAVRQTAGVLLFYRGTPIDAMYASTCGGRTEDFAEVFESSPVPYLVSVPCTSEEGTGGSTGMVLAGHPPLPSSLAAEDGTSAHRNLALARALGIAGHASWAAEEWSRMATYREVRQWMERAAIIARRRLAAAVKDADESMPRAEFFRLAVEELMGPDAAGARLTPSDVEYFLSNLRDGTEVPDGARAPLARLIQARLCHPFPDNTTRPLEGIRRVHGLILIAGILERVRPDLLRGGTLESSRPQGESAGTEITVRGGGRTRSFPLSDDLSLFRLQGERSAPVESLSLIGNERLRFHLDPAGRIGFLEVELNVTGTASDRFSPQAAWQATFTVEALAEKLRPLVPDIGEIRDIIPSRLGKSGRAVQIEIVGTRRSVKVSGYKVRNALGLKDTLFAIRRYYGPGGAVDKLVFDGRGWGHGVGMCQVGAYGMARAGRSYEEILKAYYSGVELQRAY